MNVVRDTNSNPPSEACPRAVHLPRTTYHAFRIAFVLCLTGSMLFLSGCTSRGMTVTSEPPGAEVSINRRVVGETPIRVAFTHYGTYRLELRKRGYLTLVREENVNPPAYGYDPIAPVADNLLPARLNDDVYFHYVLKLQDNAGADVKDDENGEKDQDNGGNGGNTIDTSKDKKIAANNPRSIEEKMEREKALKDSLLARAEQARSGAIVHPKTHEQIQIDVGPEAAKKDNKVADTDEPVKFVDTYSVIGPELAPNLALPSDLGPVARIQERAPKPPTLAEELDIEPTAAPSTPVATPASVPPAGSFSAPEPRKAEAPRVARMPKDEELIYDKSDVVDPSQKKKK